MEQPGWNEGRLDDLNRKVDEEFTAVRSEMHAGFARMQWTLVGAAAVVIGALIGAPHL